MLLAPSGSWETVTVCSRAVRVPPPWGTMPPSVLLTVTPFTVRVKVELSDRVSQMESSLR